MLSTLFIILSLLVISNALNIERPVKINKWWRHRQSNLINFIPLTNFINSQIDAQVNIVREDMKSFMTSEIQKKSDHIIVEINKRRLWERMLTFITPILFGAVFDKQKCNGITSLITSKIRNKFSQLF